MDLKWRWRDGGNVFCLGRQVVVGKNDGVYSGSVEDYLRNESRFICALDSRITCVCQFEKMYIGTDKGQVIVIGDSVNKFTVFPGAVVGFARLDDVLLVRSDQHMASLKDFPVIIPCRGLKEARWRPRELVLRGDTIGVWSLADLSYIGSSAFEASEVSWSREDAHSGIKSTLDGLEFDLVRLVRPENTDLLRVLWNSNGEMSQVARLVVAGMLNEEYESDGLGPYLVNANPFIQDIIRKRVLNQAEFVPAKETYEHLQNLIAAEKKWDEKWDNIDMLRVNVSSLVSEIKIAPQSGLVRALALSMAVVIRLDMIKEVLPVLMGDAMVIEIAKRHKEVLETLIAFLSSQDADRVQATLKCLIMLTRKAPGLVETHLYNITHQLMRSLDPAASLRAEIIDHAIIYLSETVKTFQSISYDPLHSRIAIASAGQITVYDLQSTAPIFDHAAHPSEISCCTFSPDGRRLVTISLAEDTLRVWRMPGPSLTSQAWTNWTKERLTLELKLHVDIDSAIESQWDDKHLTLVIGENRIGLTV